MYLLIVFLFLSPFVYGKSKIYEKSADCSPIYGQSFRVVNAKVIHHDLNITQGEIITELQQRVLSRAFEELIDSQYNFKIDNIAFYSQIQERNKKRRKIAYARMKLSPVESCIATAQPILDGEIYKLHTMDLSVINSSEISFEVNLEKLKKKSLNIENATISSRSVMGAKFGERFEDIQSRFGRFSLIWPLGSERTIALVGRNHAFYFSSNKLVGYQFSESLLPVSLSNHLEIFKKPLTIQLENDHQIGFNDISSEDLLALESEFKNLITVRVGDAFSEQVTVKIESFSIGEVTVGAEEVIPSCLEMDDLTTGFNDKKEKLISFFSQDNKVNYLSACNQLVSMKGFDEVGNVSLIDSWSMKGVNLGYGNIFVGFAPWTFLSIKKGTSIEALKQHGTIDVFMDDLEFVSKDGDWSGKFYLENNMLVSGEIDMLAL
ncbi:hypothetical protein [Pseudoalteromonas phenolica]|uniref:hypothetical protein n=1 Tax=Pseudoalteromonas phenolica TaxID=161398 RepID=UPI00384CF010